MFRVIPLDPSLDRNRFCSGANALDRYFRDQVTQDIRRRVTTCFVAVDDADRIAGFYTLASAGVLLADLPEHLARKLPRYPTVPVVRMGRLAVDESVRGLGLGGALLADALARVAHSEIGAYALIVDAKDDAAVAFYRHHGFAAFGGRPQILFLPNATAAAASRSGSRKMRQAR
jgi:GNAT superfamily N-acetyltransferase